MFSTRKKKMQSKEIFLLWNREIVCILWVHASGSDAEVSGTLEPRVLIHGGIQVLDYESLPTREADSAVGIMKSPAIRTKRFTHESEDIRLV